MLQSGGMRGRGLGWKAERCVDPGLCELYLCVADDEGGYWHPEDPLAFAKWRVRADLDAIPAHVMVRVQRGSDGSSPAYTLLLTPGNQPGLIP